MGIELQSAVLRHLSRVRENPARAVSPDELEELERFAREDRTRSYVARMSPTAKYTWTSRVGLDTSQDQSDIDTIDDFGCPVTIVGLLPLVLALEASPDSPTPGTKVLPPIEAFDVQITIDRGAKELRTAANSPVSGGQERPQFAPLASVSAVIANRLLDQDLGLNDQISVISFSYRWTVNSTIRAALGWSNVQISMGVMYELAEGTRPRGKGR
jgi:hypothetical protein